MSIQYYEYMCWYETLIPITMFFLCMVISALLHYEQKAGWYLCFKCSE